ncbi:hypothetical protein QBC37DRAFT_454113 [Rhypophila decipiens]|uniref:Uncharacterized protein n=1 Tax=Rhypophila decipiens TaxID=261697 RepID=A0AAN7BD76_9PEZI|nr:hypothetical protein QBC37DRAFT_454113 [Rhypophila decipiens]
MPTNQRPVFRFYSDIPGSILRINDTLITRLGRTNRLEHNQHKPLARANPTPPPPEGYTLQIGTFLHDLPPVPIPVHLRITTGFFGPSGPPTHFPLPPQRNRGAPAYLRVSLNPHTSIGIIFETVDAKGDLAYPNADPTTTVLSSMSRIYDNILLDSEFPTIRDSRSRAMLRHDGATINQLSIYDRDWVIYWARNRLLKAMEFLRQVDPSNWEMIEWVTAGGESYQPRVIAKDRSVVVGGRYNVVENHEEDYRVLRTITTCADVVRELGRIEVLEERSGPRMRTVLDESGL